MEKSKTIIFGARYYDNSDYAIESGINLVIFYLVKRMKTNIQITTFNK
jgi:hypothetical protein